MLKRLKACFIKPAKNLAGSYCTPPKAEKITECYAKLNIQHRFQGDVYPATAFETDAFPAKSVPYWGVINRTCHLYEDNVRSIKLPFLTYAAVYPLCDVINKKSKIKEQVTNLVCGKTENFLFLPADSEHYEISEPLVFNFNILYSLPVERCPSASDKCIQLSSPFCEHAFQKLARYFYTVGYEDGQIKSQSNINELIKYVESKID
jgi:hypothetical protein